MKIFMFPGQGSQAKGMGGALFDEFPEFTMKADEILNFSIKDLCLNDPNRKLGQTQYTQSAIYVVSALSYYKKIKNSQQKPDYVLGHSLGEYNALLAAEVFDFETGLKLVKKRGELMNQATGGGMTAVLNCTEEQIKEILKENGLFEIDLANYNTPSQIVISGLKAQIAKAESSFQKKDIKFVSLNTSGAFHSRQMESAKKEFEQFLTNYCFSEPKIPVISNVTAKPYQNDQIIDNMANQITSPVKWFESIQYLIKFGNIEFEEIGHGDVLKKMLKKNFDDFNTSQITQSVNNHMNIEEINENKQKNAIVNEWGTIRTKSMNAQEKVNMWNQKYPKGTRVISTIMANDNLETRTEAKVLFGHRAAVYMKGHNGYFDLDEIVPI